MNTTTKKRAALYIRVSTEEQAKHGYSLTEQAHDLRQYAEQHGYIIIGIYADEGISARKALSRRKALQRLLDDVRAGVVNIIIFKALCQLSWKKFFKKFSRQAASDELDVICYSE